MSRWCRIVPPLSPDRQKKNMINAWSLVHSCRVKVIFSVPSAMVLKQKLRDASQRTWESFSDERSSYDAEHVINNFGCLFVRNTMR